MSSDDPGFLDDEDVVNWVLSKFAPRDAEIIRLRWGLGGSAPLTLEEVGDRMGLTRERIRQIETRVLSKLRSAELRSQVQEYLRQRDDATQHWDSILEEIVSPRREDEVG